jgi:hypothetical protein
MASLPAPYGNRDYSARSQYWYRARFQPRVQDEGCNSSGMDPIYSQEMKFWELQEDERGAFEALFCRVFSASKPRYKTATSSSIRWVTADLDR